MQTITVLGATGSIGTSTLNVLAQHPNDFSIYALTAHQNVHNMAKLCQQFQPKYAVVGTADHALILKKLLQEVSCITEILYGTEALESVAAAPEVDTVMSAIVGAAGLLPTLAAVKSGKRVLLANKEALVMSGALFMEAVSTHRAVLLPIDSEHNAIWQSLPDTRKTFSSEIEKIVLTASGGPFRQRSLNSFIHITPEEAIAHPNWSMGKKISVDSATMMNKGLEVIEAHYLFSAPPESIEVLIHPQSVIHSMVRYIDGSVIAELGCPDMRTPIAHALAYPQRISAGVKPLDLTIFTGLSFERPDMQRFPCLKLAYQALNAGGIMPAVLNAANEIAVEAFLNKQLTFTDISEAIDFTLSHTVNVAAENLEIILDADIHARNLTRSYITKKSA
jgi:1-deoxy-D-xylulose-5-phosphate reductoisomerase